MKKTNKAKQTQTLDSIHKAQIKMHKKSKNGTPQQKHINKLVLAVNAYVSKLNISEEDKIELLEILSEHFISEVLFALDES